MYQGGRVQGLAGGSGSQKHRRALPQLVLHKRLQFRRGLTIPRRLVR
jgi:hypothetical protein